MERVAKQNYYLDKGREEFESSSEINISCSEFVVNVSLLVKQDGKNDENVNHYFCQ